jgi:hypothetical protein
MAAASGPDARFVSFAPGQWYLEINIRASDTEHIPIGSYYYNSTLGSVELESGLLQIVNCDISAPSKRNYPIHVFNPPMPFLNPPQVVKFNTLSYLDKTSFMGNTIL